MTADPEPARGFSRRLQVYAALGGIAGAVGLTLVRLSNSPTMLSPPDPADVPFLIQVVAPFVAALLAVRLPHHLRVGVTAVAGGIEVLLGLISLPFSLVLLIPGGMLIWAAVDDASAEPVPRRKHSVGFTLTIAALSLAAVVALFWPGPVRCWTHTPEGWRETETHLTADGSITISDPNTVCGDSYADEGLLLSATLNAGVIVLVLARSRRTASRGVSRSRVSSDAWWT